MDKTILDVENLRIRYAGSPREAVRGVSFTLGRERLGIVGDTLRFEDTDLLSLREKEMLKVRGRRMSMILQDPKFSLNPIRRVGDQVAETYLRHFKCSRREAHDKAVVMLEAVKIRDAERVFKQYPHEISGGMGQRVMIAMMLLADPDLVIADEPTSALDVTVRLQVLTILDKLVRDRGIGLIMISHDLNLVRNFCDRVLIMYAGKVVETLKASELDQARHPYTQGLLAAQPRIGGPRGPLAVLDRKPEWLEEQA
jgi:peptide/nickel transport system ATP-binding protein